MLAFIFLAGLTAMSIAYDQPFFIPMFIGLFGTLNLLTRLVD